MSRVPIAAALLLRPRPDVDSRRSQTNDGDCADVRWLQKGLMKRK